MPDAPETKVRGRTGAIGFSGKAGDTLVKSLSGGEKARLLLGLATFFGPNMIILDERPTTWTSTAARHSPRRSTSFPARSSWSRMTAI